MSCNNNYLKDLPDDYALQTDWALVSEDSTRLPVHSSLLKAISPIFTELASTKKCGGSEIPFAKTSDVAITFLRWLYRQDFILTLDIAKELATLSHTYNIPSKSYAMSK